MRFAEGAGTTGLRVNRVDLGSRVDDAAASLRTLLTSSGLLVLTGQAGSGDDALVALLGAAGRSRPSDGGTGPAVVGVRGAALDGARFSDQHRAFDTLPPDLRAWLIGRRVRSTPTGSGRGPTRTSTQPIFRRHPFSGRVALHLPPPGHTASISGLPDEVAAATIASLAIHAARDENLLRPDACPDDVVVWDTWSVRLAPGPTSFPPAAVWS